MFMLRIIFGIYLSFLAFAGYAKEGGFGQFLDVLNVLSNADNSSQNQSDSQKIETLKNVINIFGGNKDQNKSSNNDSSFKSSNQNWNSDEDSVTSIEAWENKNLNKASQKSSNSIKSYSLNYSDAYVKAHRLDKDKKYDEAYKYFKMAADQGEINSLVFLGLYYQHGRAGLKINYQKARDYYLQAADQNNSYAYINLANLYRDGKGVTKDLKQSAKYRITAMELGHPDASKYIYFPMFHGTQGYTRDKKRAIKIATELANKNDEYALNNLSIWYTEGNGVEKDAYKGFEFARKLETYGTKPDHLYTIAWHYYTATGTTKNKRKAKSLLEKSVKAGKDGPTLYMLGLIYEYGLDDGTGIDYAKALDFYKKSIKVGDLKNEESAINKIAKLSKKVDQGSYVAESSIVDKIGPNIRVNQGEYISTEDSLIEITGIAIDDSKISEIIFDGEVISRSSSGDFSTEVYVSLGDNTFLIEAVDTKGNKSSKRIKISRKEPKFKNKDKKLRPPKKSFASNPNAVAIIIGIDKYESIGRAKWAEADAKVFYDFAQKSLGISSDRIKIITGKDSDLKGIWKTVDQWLPAFIEKDRSDVYLYFAGHGLASQGGDEVFLIPWDGDPDLLDRSAINRSELFASINKLSPRNVTMFMDTCYSGDARGGSGVLVADARGLRIVKRNTSQLPKNFTLFSAASNEQTAHSHPALKHGLFSYWLMRGLSGEADADNNEKITNGELHEFVSSKVNQTAVTVGNKQSPQLSGDTDRVISRW